MHCTTVRIETERVSVFPGLSLGHNPVFIVYSVLSITG